jgi:hypothetical protein
MKRLGRDAAELTALADHLTAARVADGSGIGSPGLPDGRR